MGISLDTRLDGGLLAGRGKRSAASHAPLEEIVPADLFRNNVAEKVILGAPLAARQHHS